MSEMNPLLDAVSDFDDVILSDRSGRLLYNRKSCILTLTRGSMIIFSIEKDNKESQKLVELGTTDLIGMQYFRHAKQEGNFKVEFYFYPEYRGFCFGFGKSKPTNIKRCSKTLTIIFTSSNERECNIWKRAVHEAARGITFSDQISSLSLQRHFLVIISPKSGAGKSLSIWKNIVEPIFEKADIHSTVIVTERKRHAYDIARDPNTNFSLYHAIIILGGDGIVFEIVNGIADRPMITTSTSITEESNEDQRSNNNNNNNMDILRRLVLVPLGGGSGNGLVASLLHENSHAKTPVHAAILAVKGHPQPMDLTRVTTVDGRVSHAFLTLMWGILSDIDLQSEWLRCLGETRMYVYAVMAIVRKQIYRGKLSLKIVRSWSTYTGESSFYENRVNRTRESERIDQEGWLHMSGDFVSVNVFQTSHISTSAHVCPGKKFDDGVFLVTVLDSGISRYGLIEMLLTVDDGGLLNHSHVRVFRCSEYIFEPEGNDGLFSLDGESVAYGKIHGEILPNATQVML
jgi:sphingosine kinase